MTTAGGGALLVGRSVAGGGGELGWTVTRGNVRADDAPYALAVVDAGIGFTEILVGAHSGTKTFSNNAYTMTVPGGFVATYADAAVEVWPVTTVQGTCARPRGPGMLRYAGFTSSQRAFFFRDTPEQYELTYYGLQPGSFELEYTNCNYGAGLMGEQGEVFVR